jgi:hypothetical protein
MARGSRGGEKQNEEWRKSEGWRGEYGQGEGDVNGLRGGAAGLGYVCGVKEGKKKKERVTS